MILYCLHERHNLFVYCRNMVARNLMQVVAVALVPTKALLCHDLKNTDLKVRFCGDSGYLFFTFYL